MAFSQIETQSLNCCPHCQGKTGVKYHQHAYARFAVKWGNTPQQRELISYQVTGTPVKTVVCMDCGKRFKIEVKADE